MLRVLKSAYVMFYAQLYFRQVVFMLIVVLGSSSMLVDKDFES